MSAFRAKTIDHEATLAEILAAARARRGVTIADAARALNIQPHHLQAFEDGHVDALPGELYARKYLERYGHYLGVPADMLRARLEESLRGGLWARSPREIRVTHRHFAVWPQRIRRAAAGLAVVAVVGYFAYALAMRMQPPPLALDYPPDGLVTHVAAVTVSGKTEPEARLTMNGAAVPVGADGRFSIFLNMSDGINYIRLTAARRAGKEKVVEVKVIRE